MKGNNFLIEYCVFAKFKQELKIKCFSYFLQFVELRKLSLKGLHLMPNICDLSFKLVFRHLKVKEFCMSSDVPLTSVRWVFEINSFRVSFAI